MPAKSKGVVLFAFNTDLVNYVGIAEQAARLIHHTLDLPVTLITDVEVISNYVDQIIYTSNSMNNKRQGYADGTAWRNGGRYTAYELSPYDETLLLDSDYLVLDKSLLTLLDSTTDYTLIHKNRNLTQSMSGNMGDQSLDYIWATAIPFKRTNKTELLFALVGRIQRNYQYYRELYQIRERNFRNDYAFAMANNIVSGYAMNKSQGMPWNMLTLDQKIEELQYTGDTLVVREQQRAHVLPVQNIHVMDKEYLQSSAHIEFIDTICTE